MAFCRQCGKQINDGMVICSECDAANKNVNNAANAQQVNNGAATNNQQNNAGADNTNAQNNTFVNDAVNSTVKTVMSFLDTNETTGEYSPAEIEKNKVICALAYIPILFWLPLVAGTKGSKYCKFHVNQGLLLLIVSVVFSMLNIIIGLIPIVGIITWTLASLVELGYLLFGLIYTIMGHSKELPLIGGIKIIQ